MQLIDMKDTNVRLIKGTIFQVFVRLTAKLRISRSKERLALSGDGELVFQELCHLVDMR